MFWRDRDPRGLDGVFVGYLDIRTGDVAGVCKAVFLDWGGVYGVDRAVLGRAALWGGDLETVSRWGYSIGKNGARIGSEGRFDGRVDGRN
jgi:hypothetical protein